MPIVAIGLHIDLRNRMRKELLEFLHKIVFALEEGDQRGSIEGHAPAPLQSAPFDVGVGIFAATIDISQHQRSKVAVKGSVRVARLKILRLGIPNLAIGERVLREQGGVLGMTERLSQGRYAVVGVRV